MFCKIGEMIKDAGEKKLSTITYFQLHNMVFMLVFIIEISITMDNGQKNY
jgi:hypothetical protein